MKKKYSFSVAVIIAALVFLLFSCNGEIGSAFCSVTVDFANGSEPVTTQVPAGFEFTLTSTVPVREGYEFSYWESSDGGRYSSGDKIKITADVTFKAIWIEEGTLGEDEAFVSFYLNGNLFAKQKIKKGTKVEPPTLSDMNISDGFDFDGWYVGDVKFDFNAVVTDSIILTATCVRKTCTVTYDYGGDRGQVAVTVNWGDTLSRPSDPTDSESTFDGWYRDGNKYLFGTRVEENFTLNAEWIGKNQVSVNIRYNNGEKDYREVLSKGGFYSLPDISGHTKEGHDFSGWYVDGDETLHNSGEQIVLSESRDLSAGWTTKNYTVSFNPAGGSEVDDVVLPWNSLFTPPVSTQTGYTLKGWYDGEEKYTSKTRITKDVTLTAKWEAAVYEVVFLSDEGGTVTARKQVKHGDTISATTKTPSKKGHTFAGNWLKEDNTVFDFSSPVTGSLTLHPEWNANSITVTFMNGEEEFATKQVKWGDTLDKPESDPTPENAQKFLYWSSDGTDGFDFSSPVESDTDITLKAVFAGDSDYIVTFDYNDGVTATEIKKATGGTFNFPSMLELPKKEGEVITAWIDSKGDTREMEWTDSDGKHYLYGNTMTISEDMIFTAVWSKKKVSVYFNSFSDDEYEPYEIDWGSTITQPANPTKREGRTFLYWHTSDIWNTPYDFSTPVTQDSITLYAEWDRTSVSYTLNPDNGEASICGEVMWGETITPCIDPLKENKVFLGWFEEEATSSFDFSKGLRKDTVLTAKWGDSSSGSESGKVTVTYNLDGNGTKRTITVDKGSRIYLYSYTPSSTGTQAFDYWKDESGNKVDISYSDITVTENREFTAVWTSNMVTVTFNPYNTPHNSASSNYITKTIAYGSKITDSIKPEDPERDNCVFQYWIDSTNGYSDDQKPFDFENTPITQNTSFTAVWDKSTFLVIFDPGNGETSSKSVQMWGSTIYPPADPVWEGHIFTGWFTEDDSEFDFSTPITGTTVLTAHWSEEEKKKDGKSTITFDWGDGVTVETVTVVTGSEYSFSSYTPRRKGYTLVSWKTDAGEEIVVENGQYASRKIDSDIRLTAQWELREMELHFYLNSEDFHGGSGDNSYADASVIYGQKIKDQNTVARLTAPEKEGYKFDGWMDNDTGVYFNPNDAFCPSSEGTKYYFIASWIPEDRTVTVVYDDVRTDTLTVKYGDTLLLPTPKMSGYRFKGWKIDSQNYYNMTPVTENMNLTAEWEKTETYTVHFMYADGTECSEKEVESGKSVSVSDIEVIAPEGTSFQGWYEGNETFDPFIYTSEPYSFDNSVSGDIYLYAKFTFDNIASSWVVAGTMPLILTVTDGRNVIMSAMGAVEDMREVGEWDYDRSTGQIEFTITDMVGIYVAGKMPWFNPNNLGKTGEFLSARKLYTSEVVKYESLRRTAVKDSIVGEWSCTDGRWNRTVVFTDEKSMETLLMYSDNSHSGEPLVTIRSTADYRKGENGEYTYLDENGYDLCGEIEVTYSSLVSYAVSATELGTYGFVMDSVSFTKSSM